jgi:formate hydrogenlyase transcriptional activator
MFSERRSSPGDSFLPFSNSDSSSPFEKLIADYFDSATIGLAIFDCDLRYVAINRTLAAVNGKSVSDHRGKTVREILGDFADSVEPYFQQVLSTGEEVRFEVSGTLPATGETGHWASHYFPIKDQEGRVARIGAMVVDIAAQKKLEESVAHLGGKLRQKTGRLQMLSDVTGILSSNWDVSKVFPQISARIRRVLHQEFASFALRDPGTGLLVPQAIDFPLSKGHVPSVQVIGPDTPAGRSVEERSPLIFTREQLHSFEGESAKGLINEGLQSLCCVPLLRPRGPLGVFVLGSTRHDAFQAEDLELVNQVAAQLAIAIENHRAATEVELLKQRLGEERRYLEGDTRPEGQFAEIIGDSPALRLVLDQVTTVAPSDATVLILGETGTGKELIARAIHRLSRRKDGAFIKVNCAAIPTGLLESELFGHEKGAFTGAVSRKIGRMELADGGTLFLDEIGEIPLELQPKLLRVLQDQEFERLGSNRTIRVNVRLVAATNRNLAQSISKHEFRSDLFYRLSVFPIQLPSLRERKEDIPLLVRHFVHKFAHRMDRFIETIPKDTMKALMAWPWPGNIRELENLMERSVILSEGNSLRVPLSELRSEPSAVSTERDHTLDTAERAHIVRVLRETKGVLSGPDGAARRLGLKRTTLQSKMQRLKITRNDYSDPSKK